MNRLFRIGLLVAALAGIVTVPSRMKAQESPYMVTYDHYLEEPGNLEVEYFSTLGTQRGGNDFHAGWLEFEYGATAWWTTELYLDGQTTFDDSTVFTGFRWENRFRLLQHEHFLNPVLYIEYEQISEADKIVKEVEGHDVEADHAEPNAVLRQGHNHELELKLLLSKNFKGWNLAVNPLATKPLWPSSSWEFGYAIGASRPPRPVIVLVCSSAAILPLRWSSGQIHRFANTSSKLKPARTLKILCHPKDAPISPPIGAPSDRDRRSPDTTNASRVARRSGGAKPLTRA